MEVVYFSVDGEIYAVNKFSSTLGYSFIRIGVLPFPIKAKRVVTLSKSKSRQAVIIKKRPNQKEWSIKKLEVTALTSLRVLRMSLSV